MFRYTYINTHTRTNTLIHTHPHTHTHTHTHTRTRTRHTQIYNKQNTEMFRQDKNNLQDHRDKLVKWSGKKIGKMVLESVMAIMTLTFFFQCLPRNSFCKVVVITV